MSLLRVVASKRFFHNSIPPLSRTIGLCKTRLGIFPGMDSKGPSDDEPPPMLKDYIKMIVIVILAPFLTIQLSKSNTFQDAKNSILKMISDNLGEEDGEGGRFLKILNFEKYCSLSLFPFQDCF